MADDKIVVDTSKGFVDLRPGSYKQIARERFASTEARAKAKRTFQKYSVSQQESLRQEASQKGVNVFTLVAQKEAAKTRAPSPSPSAEGSARTFETTGGRRGFASGAVEVKGERGSIPTGSRRIRQTQERATRQSQARVRQERISRGIPGSEPTDVVSVSPALSRKFVEETLTDEERERTEKARSFSGNEDFVIKKIRRGPGVFIWERQELAKEGDRAFIVSRTRQEAEAYAESIPRGENAVKRAVEGTSFGLGPGRGTRDLKKKQFAEDPLGEFIFNKEFVFGLTKTGLSAIRGTAIIARETIVPDGAFFPGTLPIMTPGRIQRRMELGSNPDVQTASVAAGLIGASIYAPGTVPFIQAAGIAGGGYNIFKGIQDLDPERVGEGVFLVGTSQPIGFFRDVGIRATGTRVKSTDIFSDIVTSKSSFDALKQFEAGRTPEGTMNVFNVGPSSLRYPEVKAGPKGEAGLEDRGLFVGPFGRANILFTRLATGFSEKIGSFIPKDPLGLKRPRVTEIEVKDIGFLPDEVAREPGFSGPKRTAFEESASKSGKAFITKRSQLGKGELSRQTFEAPSDFKQGNFNIKKGDIRIEAGTSESEAIIPTGAILENLGNPGRRFTVVNQVKVFGRKVPLTGNVVRLPKARLLGQEGGFESSGLSGVTKGVQSGKTIKASSSSLTSEGSLSIPFFSVGTGGGSSVSSERVSSALGSSSVFSGISSGVSSIDSDGFSSRIESSSGGSGFSDFGSSGGSRVSDSVVGSSSSSESLTSPISSGDSFFPRSPGVSLVSPDGSGLGGFDTSFSLFASPRKSRGPRIRGGGSSFPFSVEVRRRGRFREVGRARSRREATRLGLGRVRESPAASFRLFRQGQSVLPQTLPSDFRLGLGGTVVERRRFRINTPGELSGITRLGIFATRGKNKRRLF